MPRRPLSLKQVRDLVCAMRVASASTTALHQHFPMGKYIKYPPIPQVLSESIALHALREGLIPDIASGVFELGSRKDDSDIVALSRGARLKIEIKATGDKAFQRWSNGDIESDYVIWIHFGTYFQGPEEIPITFYVVPEVGNYYSKTGHVSLDDFLRRTESSRVEHSIQLDQLCSKQRLLL